MAKDTRPLRERPYQVKMRQDIIDWCRSNDLDVQPQVLQNITAKDFRVIFEQLIQCLDPEWAFDPAKNLGDQLIQALKALYYPYVGFIDLKWLSAPGAPYSWPSLLGMLHWLAEFGRVRVLLALRLQVPLINSPSGKARIHGKRRSHTSRS